MKESFPCQHFGLRVVVSLIPLLVAFFVLAPAREDKEQSAPDQRAAYTQGGKPGEHFAVVRTGGAADHGASPTVDPTLVARKTEKADAQLQTPSDLCKIEQNLASATVSGVCDDIRFLGTKTFVEMGLVPPDFRLSKAFSKGADGVAEMQASRHFWEYDGFLITVRKQDLAAQTRLLYVAAALSGYGSAARPSMRG